MQSRNFRRQVLLLLTLALSSGCAHTPPAPEAMRTEASASSLPPVSPPSDPETLDTLSQSLLQKGFDSYRNGDYPRAISYWEASSLVAPQAFAPWTQYLLCYCYMTTGRYDEAMSLAEKLLEEDPYQPLPYQQLGIAQLWIGKPKAARENFQRALGFDSHSPRVHFYVGLAETQLGHPAKREEAFDLGVKEYDEILRRNPDDFSANYELASLLLFRNQDLDRASLLLARAKQNFGNAPESDLEGDRRLFLNYYVPLLEGVLLYRKNEIAGSRQVLLRALTNLPSGARADVAELYYYLGNAYARLGEISVAREFLQKGKVSDPVGPYAAMSVRAIRELASRSTSP